MKDNYSIVLKENPIKILIISKKKLKSPALPERLILSREQFSSDSVFILRINLYEWFILIIYFDCKVWQKNLTFERYTFET